MRSARKYLLPSVSWALWLLLPAMLLTLPLRWLFAAAASILWHEACHYLALRAMGEPVYGVSISPEGLIMHTASLPAGKELICALAGPVGGLMLFLFCRQIPRLALCALFHSACNLLPVYPLDGGRALQSLLMLLLPRKGKAVFRVVQRLGLALVVLVCLWASFAKKLGWIPLVMALVLLRKGGTEVPLGKNLAKKPRWLYNKKIIQTAR